MLRHLPTLVLLMCLLVMTCADLSLAQPPPMALELAAPIATWDEGVPLGNGLTGGLLWGGGNTINLSLDRGDLWDERLPELYLQDNWNYDTIRRLVAEGKYRILIDKVFQLDAVPQAQTLLETGSVKGKHLIKP